MEYSYFQIVNRIFKYVTGTRPFLFTNKCGHSIQSDYFQAKKPANSQDGKYLIDNK